MIQSYTPDMLKKVPSLPGVYFMKNKRGDVIYVGKAKNLKKRIESYFLKGDHNQKTMNMVAQIQHFDLIATKNEHDALLLENEKIKLLQPKYNILLKDDKSFPYIVLWHHDFPRLSLARGRSGSKKGDYFGPFTGVKDLRGVMDEMQKLFLLRTCRDGVFHNRSRPCLLYQIKRCSGPCVGHVSKEEYAMQVDQFKAIFSGDMLSMIAKMQQRMLSFSESQHYEQAAFYRDIIQKLQKVSGQSEGGVDGIGVDMITMMAFESGFYFQISTFRNHRIQNSQGFYIEPVESDEKQVAFDFISAYINRQIDHERANQLWFEGGDLDFSMAAAFLKTFGVKLLKSMPQKYENLKAVHHQNIALWQDLHIDQIKPYEKVFSLLADAIQIDRVDRIECVDISHTFGQMTRASRVCIDQKGPVKNHYRVYKLDTKNDDYASMRIWTEKRFALNKDPSSFPTVLLIDGGKGQINAVLSVLTSLYEKLPVVLIAITKNEKRQSGKERYYLIDDADKSPKPIDFDDSIKRCFEFVRDEAHRFAIKNHRNARDKNTFNVDLLEIPGVGKKRLQTLLMAFGGIEGVKQADINALSSVHGISHDLAKKIHQFYHP